MKKLIAALSLLLTAATFAATRDNDASCDISLLPAATLLLPYFEVDLGNQLGETTLFTITNVTNADQIAHVTLWTDRAYPAFNFDVLLTGYDVQSINLYDVLARGAVGSAPPPRPGRYSLPNAALDTSGCASLPRTLDPGLVAALQEAFLVGYIDGCGTVGSAHERAIGYVTVDVVGRCTMRQASEAEYWTRDIRYDNVFIGDYVQLRGAEGSAEGGPMVHIRAVPEGATPDVRANVFHYDVFEQTFYGDFQPADAPRLDGRQPLPSQFAARFAGESSLKIWRQADAGPECGAFGENGALAVREIVAFDESENAVAAAPPSLPATSRTFVGDADVFPQLTSGAPGGWMYLNLHQPGRSQAAQNWVVSSFTAAGGRLATDTDAVALGNGCSAPARLSEVSRAFGATIGPAPNDDRRDDEEGVTTRNDDSCDIALLPAATLLLPHFQVDLDNPNGQTTLFSVTNVTPEERIARVTLWTDYGYPVLWFNLYLTGYDVQSISLSDVVARGAIAPPQGTGTDVSARGAYSDRNRQLDLRGCGRLAGQLPPEYVELMKQAFTLGEVPELGGVAGCAEVGNVHDNAVGYATIDIVRNCGSEGPFSADYWREDLAYDNVLIGDSHFVHASREHAQSSPMVHVRAVPEGGGAVPFERTFYGRYQTPRGATIDARQPLPSTFAARWLAGSMFGYATTFHIWRGPTVGREAECGLHDENVRPVVELVRFDEAENAVASEGSGRVNPFPTRYATMLPVTARVHVNDASVFPLLTNGASAGWMYMNLDDDAADAYATQNWVVTTISSQSGHSVAIDAAALGNGCSAAAGKSVASPGGTAVIGPAPNRAP